MRPVLPWCLLLALLGSCSREPTESPATPVVRAPTASISLSAPVPVVDADASAPAHEVVAVDRRIRLRRRRPWPADGTPPPADLDFEPGAPPGPAHPEGTVFVVLSGDDGTYRITEWDLATRVALHETKLDPPRGNLQIFARGPSVRVMAHEFNGELDLLQLTDALQLVANNRLGQVSVAGPNALAGDDSLTVVLADGIPDETGSATDPSGLFAMSFDQAGKRIAKRILLRGQEASRMSGNLAVIGGHVYVALIDSANRLRVLQLSPELRTEREKPMAIPPVFENVRTKLRDVDGHLILDVEGQPDWLEVSLDLSRLTHRPRPAPVPDFPGKGCGQAVRMATQLLALCDCGRSTCLAWTPPSPPVQSP